MIPRVYMAGPIHGCTDQEALSWRLELSQALPGWVTVSPMARDYRGREAGRESEIVSADLADIRSSQAVVAMAMVPSWGTAMEVMYAHTHGIPVIAVSTSSSPWLVHHAIVVPSLRAALAALARVLQ